MNKAMITIVVMIVLMGIGTDVANAQINWAYIARSEAVRHTSYRGFPRIGGCVRGSRLNLRYIARSEMMRHISYGRLPYVGVGRYGRYARSGTNVRIRYNERWGLQGGQRSYEQSPDLTGKIIDGVITLGALAIISD